VVACAAVLGFAALEVARAASAASEEEPGDASDVVEVYVAGSAETVARARTTVQELLSRLDLPAIVRDAAGADEALLTGERTRAMVKAYIDLRSLDAPRVIVVDGRTREEVERRVLPASSSLETAVEASGHVLYMAVEGLVRTRAAEREHRDAVPAPARTNPAPPSPRAPPPPPVPVVAQTPDQDHSAASPSSRATWGVNGGLFGAVGSFGASQVMAGGGIGVDVAPRALAVRPGIGASVAAFAPDDVTGAGGVGSVSVFQGRVLPYIEWGATDVVALFVGAGVGIDNVRFSPSQPPPGAVAVGATTNTDFVVATELGAKLRLAETLSLVGGLGADVDPAPRRYVVDRGASRESVFAMGRVRPSLFIGLSVSFAGAPQFGARRLE
jgi:hypothetical protein